MYYNFKDRSEDSGNEQVEDAMSCEEEQIDGDQNNRDQSEDSDADEDYDPAKDPNCNGFFKKSAASKKSAKSLKRLAKNKVSFYHGFYVKLQYYKNYTCT